ncbi:hypothetical protein EV363DRAFT_1436578 [Boletus edulis]|nr:hypothetical protein EV363DRAFT_1436578 [Boletus edulis]
MSFADFKSKRQSKSSKSYVSALSGPVASVPTQSSPQASTSAVRHDVVMDTDGLYPQLPSLLEIRKTDYSGRGLWTRQHVKYGSVILSIEAHVGVLSNQHLDSRCSSCTKATSTSPFMRCSGCGTLRYCNSGCQKADWSLHKHECKALKGWAEAAPSAALGVPNDAGAGLNSGWSNEIQKMQYHKVSLQHSASVETHTHLAHSVVRYLGLTAPSDLEEYGILSTGDLVNMISRFITNTIALTSPSLTPIGAIVSPLAALANHSCLPNAIVVFPRGGKTRMKEPVMDVIALRDIAAGEEVLITYIDTTLPKAQRRQVLTETYNFTCQCPLCKQSATVVDPREAVLCPKSCGGICPLPTEENQVSRCSACKAAISDPDAVIDAARVGQEALDKATRLQSSDADNAKHLTTNIIPILVSAGLPPLSVLPPSTSAGLSAILDPGHPVRGVALAELGKLLACRRARQTASFPPSGPTRLKIAYETLLKAREELLIGFGRENEGGEVGREVRENIVALEKELGVEDGAVRRSGKT